MYIRNELTKSCHKATLAYYVYSKLLKRNQRAEDVHWIAITLNQNARVSAIKNCTMFATNLCTSTHLLKASPLVSG